MPRSAFLLPLSLTIALLSAHDAFAHGGGLDRHGCHNDRKNGGYHCHRAPAAAAPAPAAPAQQSFTPSRANGQDRSRQRVFRNCTEAREAGAAPVHRGDPGYGPHLDRDDDGVGCEPYRGR